MHSGATLPGICILRALARLLARDALNGALRRARGLAGDLLNISLGWPLNTLGKIFIYFVWGPFGLGFRV